MRKFTKIAALFLSIAMTASMFAGCAAKDDTGTASGGASSGGASSGGTAATGKAPTLKWISIGAQPKDLEMVTKELNKYSEEKINAKIEFTYLDWNAWGDRVTAMINSGDAFDIMFTNGDKYSAGVALNAFADLTDMLKETPKLTELIPEMIWKGVKIKDRIWSVPTYKDSSQTQYWVWDKEIVEKYNIDYKNIHTTKELDPALRTIQEAINKGEIKDAKYAFPTTKDGINGMFMNYDSQAGAGIGVRYDSKDLKVINIFEQPDIMETLTSMHTWYKEKMINPDAVTATDGPKWVPVSSGQGFPGSEENWGAGRGKPVVVEPWGGPIISSGTILGSVNAISSASKNKELALKYLELVNTDSKMRTMLAYGIEGTHFKDNGDGTITRDDVKKDDYSPAGYSQASFFNMLPFTPNKADQWDLVKEWNGKAVESVLLGFAFDRTKVETQMANCATVVEKFQPLLLCGASNPAVEVPKYYAALTKAGMEDIRTELQAQIDAWKATAK